MFLKIQGGACKKGQRAVEILGWIIKEESFLFTLNEYEELLKNGENKLKEKWMKNEEIGRNEMKDLWKVID